MADATKLGTDTLGVRLSESTTLATSTPNLAREAAFLIDLVAASGTWHLATRPMEAPSPGYQGRLRKAPTITTRLQDTFWGAIEYQEIDFEVANGDGAFTADYLAGLSGNGVTASRYDPVTLERIDWWVGVVSQPALGRGVLKIRASNLNLAALDPLVPKGTITAALWPKADGCYGKTIPVIIGTVPDCPLYLVNRDDTTSTYDYLVGRGTNTATLKARGPNGLSFTIPTSRAIIPLTVKSQASTGSSSTFAHVTTGTDRCLLVAIALGLDAGADTVSTITYNGVSLAKISATANGISARTEWWFLIAPATGTHNVVVTLTGSRQMLATCFGLTGVDPTMIGSDFSYTAATGTSTAPSVTIVAAAGQQVFDSVALAAESVETAGANQIQFSGQSQSVLDGFTSLEAGAASTVMSWSLGTSRVWATAAVRVKPAANYTINTTAYAGYTVARFLYPQVDAGGNPIQYVADITGLSTERSPGRAIKTLLESTTWGLSYTTATNPYTAQSFNTTAALVPAGIRLDAWLGEARPAKDYLSEWCQVQGMRLGVTAAGAWYLWVDTQRTVALNLGDGVGDGPRNVYTIGERRPSALADRISAVKVSYRPDLLNGSTLQYSYSRNVFSPAGQERPYDFPSVRDHTAGDMIACYLQQRFLYTDESVPITINGVLGRNLLEGDLITLTVPLMGYNGTTLELANLSKDLAEVRADARGWNAAIYTYTAGVLNTDPTPDPPTPPIDLTPTVVTWLPAGPTSIDVGIWGKQALIYVHGTLPKPWDYTNLYFNTVQDFASATLKDSGKRLLFHLDDLTYGTGYFFWATYVSGGVESLPQPTIPSGGSATTITTAQWVTADIGTGQVATANIAAAAVTTITTDSETSTENTSDASVHDIPNSSLDVTAAAGDLIVLMVSIDRVSIERLNTTGAATGSIELYRGATLATMRYGWTESTVAGTIRHWPGAVSYMESPGAGTFTYKLRYASTDTNSKIEVGGARTIIAAVWKR